MRLCKQLNFYAHYVYAALASARIQVISKVIIMDKRNVWVGFMYLTLQLGVDTEPQLGKKPSLHGRGRRRGDRASRSSR